MAKISIIFTFVALVAMVAAAPQSIQQPRQVVPGPAPLNGEQHAAAAAANPEQAKDLETAGSIGYGYYGGYPSYGYSSLYYGGYGGLGGYGYGGYGYPYYSRGFGGLYGGYWY